MTPYWSELWYQKKSMLCTLLIPLALLYRCIVQTRYYLYKYHLLRQTRFPVPVLIIGNITVGGTGKTPLVIALTQHLQQQGYRVGLVSRGYRGKSNRHPTWVTVNSDVTQVGDEALLLARRCNAPMVIARDRVAAVRTLLATTPCDVIISDDGLQHYALARNVEIAVLDAQRSVGNGYCLPAGPLREPINRLARTDFCVIQGQGLTRPGAYYMQLQPQAWINLRTQQQRPLTDTFTSPLHAYAGIGNPTRFFNLLRHLGLSVHEHRFADHHAFTPADFTDAAGTVLMTEKDAVKCAAFAKPNWWYLPVTAQCDEALFTAVCARLFPCN